MDRSQKIAFLHVFLLFTGLNKLYAQDPHFSQYYSSPATVNPAMIGFFDGNLRVSGIHRQQWPQYGSPFVTSTLAFELKPCETDKDYFAYGGMFLLDRSPDAVLKSTYAQGFFSYHRVMGEIESGRTELSAGLMAGFGQRRLDYSQLSFGTQFASGGFNTQLSSGEVFANPNINHLDVHAGLVYSYSREDNHYYAGASLYHIKPASNYYFLKENTIDKGLLARRLGLQAGWNGLRDNLRYAFSASYMNQAGANELLFGGAVGLISQAQDFTLYGGCWMRWNESVIPTISADWRNLTFGFSYDIAHTGKLQTRNRSVELSLSWRSLCSYKTRCPVIRY